IPLGSSSATPVIRPGPIRASGCFFSRAQKPLAALTLGVRHRGGSARQRVLRDRRQWTRQTDSEARALTLLALDLDSAAMQIDRHLDEIEAYARTDDARYIAAAMIALEQMSEIARRNADAAVRNRDDDRIGRRLGLDLDDAASGRILDGVSQ